MDSPWRKFCKQRNKHTAHKRLDRAGNPIEFLLTFEEWWSIWQESGHWHERGRYKGDYCMSRRNDLGHYEPGNVFIQLTSENARQGQTNYKHPPERILKTRAAYHRTIAKRRGAQHG